MKIFGQGNNIDIEEHQLNSDQQVPDIQEHNTFQNISDGDEKEYLKDIFQVTNMHDQLQVIRSDGENEKYNDENLSLIMPQKLSKTSSWNTQIDINEQFHNEYRFTQENELAYQSYDFAFIFAQPLLINSETAWENVVDYITEKKIIESAIQARNNSMGFMCQVGTLKNLEEILRKHPQIIHFCGHGEKFKEYNKEESYQIILEKDGKDLGMPVDLQKEVLIDMIKNLEIQQEEKKIPLVVFSSCHSEVTGRVFLQENFADHVISIIKSETILDSVCKIFADQFYQLLLSEKQSICQAFKMAKSFLKTYNNCTQNNLPLNQYTKFKLTVQDENGNLVKSHACNSFFGETDFSGISPPESMSILPQRQNKMIGRQLELQRIVDLILSHQYVNIYGMYGIGKSALIRELANYLEFRDVEMFKNGIFYFDMSTRSGEDDESEEEEIIEIIERTMNLNLGLQRKIEEFVQLTESQHILVILDHYNFRKKDDLFFKQIGQCKHVKLIVSTITQLNTVGLWVFEEIRPMTSYESYQLLINKANRQIPDEEFKDLFEATNKNFDIYKPWDCQFFKIISIPKYIVLAAAKFHNYSLKYIFNQIKNEDANSADDNLMTSLFKIQYRYLVDNYSKAAQMVRFLSLLPSGASETDIRDIWFYGENHVDQNYIHSSLLLLINNNLIFKTTRNNHKSQQSSAPKYCLPPHSARSAQMVLDQDFLFKFQRKIMNFYITKLLADSNSENKDSEFADYEQNIRAAIYRDTGQIELSSPINKLNANTTQFLEIQYNQDQLITSKSIQSVLSKRKNSMDIVNNEKQKKLQKSKQQKKFNNKKAERISKFNITVIEAQKQNPVLLRLIILYCLRLVQNRLYKICLKFHEIAAHFEDQSKYNDILNLIMGVCLIQMLQCSESLEIFNQSSKSLQLDSFGRMVQCVLSELEQQLSQEKKIDQDQQFDRSLILAQSYFSEKKNNQGVQFCLNFFQLDIEVKINQFCSLLINQISDILQAIFNTVNDDDTTMKFRCGQCGHENLVQNDNC